MDNIAVTLNNLIKTNNGQFKSPKQAAFIYGQLGGNDKTDVVKYDSTFSVYRGNFAHIQFHVNRTGVVARFNMNKSMTKPEWTPVGVSSELPPQVQKEIDHLIRNQRELVKKINSRRESRAAGQYPDDNLFNSAEKSDLSKLSNVLNALKELEDKFPGSIPSKKLLKLVG